MRRLSLLVVTGLLLACVDTGGIGGSTGCNQPPMPTAADLQEKVFNASCGLSDSCHRGFSAKADLDLSSMMATCRSLQGTMSCEFPSMSRTAVLLTKLSCADSHDCSPEFGGMAVSPDCSSATRLNQRMPASSPGPLEQCKIDAIKDWVAAGLTGCATPDAGVDAPVDAPGDSRRDR